MLKSDPISELSEFFKQNIKTQEVNQKLNQKISKAARKIVETVNYFYF